MDKRQQGYADMTWWDPHVENITDTETYLRRKFRQDVTDKSTGISQETMHARLAEIVAAGKDAGEPWRITKAKCFAAQILEQSIDVSPLDWFPAIAIWDRLSLPIAKITKGDRAKEVNAEMLPQGAVEEWQDGNADGRWLMWQDFDHSVPDWRVILSLGFPGMKALLSRIAGECRMQNAECRMENAQCTTHNAQCADPFYASCVIAMDAILSGIDRFIAQGKQNLAREDLATKNTKPHKESAQHAPIVVQWLHD
jgi:hypothetical protein